MNISLTRKISLKRLESLPTIKQGQTDDLKLENSDTRVWLSRMTVEDGQPYNNQVTIERYILQRKSNGHVDTTKPKTWQSIRQYEAK